MKKSAWFSTPQGSVRVDYDPDAPCRVCGKPVIEASVGGTDLCPWCDAGTQRPTVAPAAVGDIKDPVGRWEKETMHPYIQIVWQEEPIKEAGKNGAQVEEVITACIERLHKLNAAPFNCRENSLAITKLEEARMWLEERTRDREARGVEGTSRP